MSSFNKAIIMGNITRDIELRYTPKGTAVADITIATNRRVKQGEQWQDETTFIDVTLWGRTAELANQYLSKGSPIHIEGRHTQDTWTDKDTGKQRTKLKITAESMQFIGGGKNTNNTTQPPNPTDDNLDQQEDNIPF